MLEVVQSPNPILLQKCEPCEPGDPDLCGLALEMEKVMYKYSGVGLAAPQVGVLKRLIVIDCSYEIDEIDGAMVPVESTKKPIFLVNPEIVEASKETEESSEGCLSCPGISAPVIRHVKVKVKYFDLDGNQQEIEGTGLLSHCLQHEIDHLNGKTIFQTCLPEERLRILQEYREAVTNGAIPGQVS